MKDGKGGGSRVIPNRKENHYVTTLTEKTLADLRAYFPRVNHRPSEAMWAALGESLGVMEAMANGKAVEQVYLSSLAPGVGKTQSVVHFLANLTTSPDHPEVGAIVCLSRKAEIEAAVVALRKRYSNGIEDLIGLPFGIGVLTADDESNALGDVCDPQAAKVLFTTQQMIDSRCRWEQFPDIAAFHFKGKPRQVRIWDESLLPGVAITVDQFDIVRAAGLLRGDRYLYRASNTLLDFVMTLRADKKEGVVAFPDLDGLGLSVNEALALAPSPLDQNRITDIWRLSGNLVGVRREAMLDGDHIHTCLDYLTTLQKSLTPLLVMDASGACRATYEHWSDTHAATLHHLPLALKAPKDYSNLTINCWETSGGKKAFKTRGPELLRAVSDVILSRPNEDFLVIHHKKVSIKGIDCEEVVRRETKGHTGTISFLPWGMHHGTNQFANVPNVILAGVLHYPVATTEALARLATNKHPIAGPVEPAIMTAIRDGEHAHNVLQALCRGAVRLCEGDQCPITNAWVIASTKSGIRRKLPKIFNRCRVARWSPFGPPKVPTGKVAAALDFVAERFTNTGADFLPNGVVMASCGITDSSNFTSSVRKHPEFVANLDKLGVGMNRRGFTRGAFVPLPTTASH